MNNNYIIEKLNKEEIFKVAELFYLVWGGDKAKLESKTKWAFNNDFSKILIIKNEKQEIVAVRGGIRWPLVYKNRTLNSYQFHGTCVHPNYRRLGLFSKLNREFIKELYEEENELIFNVSVKASRLGYEKLGWKYLNGFHRLTKVHPFRRRIKDINIPTLKIKNIPSEFIEARNKTFFNLISTKYNSSFFRWRLDNEFENYSTYISETAFIVYKLKINSRVRELIIGEIFLVNNKFSHFNNALNELINIVAPTISLCYIFENHPYYKHYIRKFYLPNPLNYNLNFGTRVINENLNISKLKWGISFLDIDTF